MLLLICIIIIPLKIRNKLTDISNYKFQHLINLKNKKRTGIIIISIIIDLV